MTVFLLMVLYAGAPSLMLDSAYADYAQCERAARPMNDARTVAVCQSVRMQPLR